MALDHVDITPGSGAQIASDSVSGVDVQVVKVDGGGDGLTVPIIAGQQTMAASLPVAVASNQTAIPTTHNASMVTLYTVQLVAADTQYSQALPANCKRVSLQCRTDKDIRMAFVAGKVATPTDPYMTIKANGSYDSGAILLASGTVYLATDDAGVYVEIEAWS